MGVDEDEFNRFVVSRWPALVRLAWLMTGDRWHADDVVVTALVGVRADWNRITTDEAPLAWTRAAVLAETMARRRQRRVEETLVALPRHAEPQADLFTDTPTERDPGRDPEPDPEQLAEQRLRVRRTLLRLPARTRAVTVLRHAEQLTEGEVARALELAPGEVAGTDARGLGSLHTALQDLPRGGGPPERVVRAALADLLETAPDPPMDPLARIEHRAREQRRRRQLVTGAVAAVLVALLALPAAFGAYDGTPTPSPSATADAASWDDPYTWPTRGSLTTDDAFLAEVKQAHGSTNTLYAGVVQDRTVVVLWNRATQTIESYKGGIDAEARELEQASSSDWPAEARLGVTVAVTSLSRGDLVVLATPDVASLQVSREVAITSEGTVSRDWERVDLDAGEATVPLGKASVSLVRAQLENGIGLPLLSVESDRQVLLANCPDCLSPDPAASFVGLARYGIGQLLGVDVESLETSLRYRGSADARVATSLTSGGPDPEIAEDAAAGTLLVAVTTLPGGQVLRTAQLSTTESAESRFAVQLETARPVRAATAKKAPFALAGDTDPEGTFLQVFAPGSAFVAALSAEGQATSPRSRVRKGSAELVTSSPTEDAQLATYDEAGRRTGVWPFDVLGATDLEND